LGVVVKKAVITAIVITAIVLTVALAWMRQFFWNLDHVLVWSVAGPEGRYIAWNMHWVKETHHLTASLWR